jgi:hypothetical protein
MGRTGALTPALCFGVLKHVQEIMLGDSLKLVDMIKWKNALHEFFVVPTTPDVRVVDSRPQKEC